MDNKKIDDGIETFVNGLNKLKTSHNASSVANYILKGPDLGKTTSNFKELKSKSQNLQIIELFEEKLSKNDEELCEKLPENLRKRIQEGLSKYLDYFREQDKKQKESKDLWETCKLVRQLFGKSELQKLGAGILCEGRWKTAKIKRGGYAVAKALEVVKNGMAGSVSVPNLIQTCDEIKKRVSATCAAVTKTMKNLINLITRGIYALEDLKKTSTELSDELSCWPGYSYYKRKPSWSKDRKSGQEIVSFVSSLYVDGGNCMKQGLKKEHLMSMDALNMSTVIQNAGIPAPMAEVDRVPLCEVSWTEWGFVGV